MRRSAVLSLVMALGFAGACSSGDESPSPFGFGADDSGSGSDAGSDDGDSDDAGSGESGGAPSVGAADETEGGIPFPGGAVDMLAEAGINMEGQRQLAYPVDAFDELVAFYDNWTSSHPGETVRSELDGQVLFQVFDGSDIAAMITIVSDGQESFDGEPITFVILVDRIGGS